MTDSVTRAEAALALWRERGEDRVNRVRFAMIEAYARRASAHEGDARRLMDARLAALLDAYAQEVERKHAPRAAERSSLLSPLLEQLNQHAQKRPDPSELADHLRTVWAKVSAEKRVRESLAQVPRNAGPLNSNSLVHRSLSLMQDVSPAYLQHFLNYLDALAWMEELTTPPAAPAKPARGKRSA
jgi:hypothetical protein